ncbi:helix-turn-helix transcriptional regulator [Rhodospira trueperi]|uniref:AraC-type DNA-binding protein n=1 Tax=Rhodospira trueperi TaxID=69960 RepID=A0A1G7ENQ0_9PROT|nr:AraC family transcriptional regulator [Rhodospira trueperi]SDE65247.1 AraC-type DNA-binding protein [Rhodospira trueperi]
MTGTPAQNTPNGRFVSREIRPGLLASLCDIRYRTDTRVEIETQPSLYIGIVVGEAAAPVTVDHCGDIEVQPLCPVLMAFGEPARCLGHHRAGVRCANVGITIAREHLEAMAETYGDDVFAVLPALVSDAPKVRHLPPSGRALAAALDMLNCPYEGALSRLHLEGCTLALLADIGSHMLPGRPSATRRLAPADIERTHAARRILDESLADPPTLAVLARRVGTNVTTLSAHFRAVFGETIRSYVRRQRLDLARTLLRTQTLPVSQIGYRVGFGNPAAFATAYRQRFGYPPSAEARSGR